MTISTKVEYIRQSIDNSMTYSGIVATLRKNEKKKNIFSAHRGDYFFVSRYITT